MVLSASKFAVVLSCGLPACLVCIGVWLILKPNTSHYPQILEETGLSEQKSQLTEYVAQDILITASRLQSGKEVCLGSSSCQQQIDTMGMELVKCVSGLPKTAVRQSI